MNNGRVKTKVTVTSYLSFQKVTKKNHFQKYNSLSQGVFHKKVNQLTVSKNDELLVQLAAVAGFFVIFLMLCI